MKNSLGDWERVNCFWKTFWLKNNPFISICFAVWSNGDVLIEISKENINELNTNLFAYSTGFHGTRFILFDKNYLIYE